MAEVTVENFRERRCSDCATGIGEIHRQGCDIERCSVCSFQRIGCECEGHDPAFARWLGFWPGVLEAFVLGVDLNELQASGIDALLFKKPVGGIY